MQRGVVAAPRKFLHALLEHIALRAPAGVAQAFPGRAAPQHHGVGFGQRRQHPQSLFGLAGAQQQVAQRNGGVEVVLGRQAGGVGRGRRRVVAGALLRLGQQGQQPAALACALGVVQQRLQALGCLRMPALQGFGFQAAGLGIQGCSCALDGCAGGQRFAIAG